MKKTIRAALAASFPVMLGYVFVGIAFGLLMREAGYGVWWVLLMSVTIYAGSMQFVAINFFSGAFTLVQIAIMTLAVNLRHIFYGLSMIDRFKGMGRKKPYMIFSLTDETYSLLCSAKVPEGVKPRAFFFLVALFDQIYWITGSIIGSLAGSLIRFNTTGIDFAMTALFLVICTEQWLSYPTRIPAVIGVCAGVGALMLLGADGFIIPAMLLSVLLLMLLRRTIEQKNDGAK
ncbi:MAG: AzlC family ABC transporter permease [Acetanaerobacterium sp.]